MESIAYCKKEGDYEEFGGVPKTQKQISRENMQARWQDAWDKSKNNDIENIEPMMRFRYYSNCKQIKLDHPKELERNQQFDNHWLIAPTGYGKSFYAREMWPGIYDKSMDKWWLGYKGEEAVLLDDFGPEEGTYMGPWLKRWTDLYPFKGEEKYGGGVYRPKTFVITGQYTISECFKDERLCAAIERRFKVKHLKHYTERTQEVLLSEEDTDILGTTEEELEDIQEISKEQEPITQEQTDEESYFVKVTEDDDDYFGSVVRMMSKNEDTTHDMVKAFTEEKSQNL